MKKKILTCIVTGVLVLSLGTASAFALSSATGKNYADTNSDGICDNRTDDKICPKDGAGKKEKHRKAAQGKNYVDKNSDGICDNRADDKTCPKDGTGKKERQRERIQESKFVDANNDGVCDNRENKAGNGKRNGCGRNGCGGRNSKSTTN